MTEVVGPAQPDVLGSPWVARRISLRPHPAYGTDPSAVLVHRDDRAHDLAVLYLHGFTDYFFHTGHAERWREAGFDLHGLDTRLHGRAIGDHARPGDVRDITHLDEEIGIALDVLRADGYRKVLMLGHSTGGIIAVSYADRHPGSIDALALNSPWFDLNEAPLRRLVGPPLIRLLARHLPSVRVGSMGREYGYSLHRTTGGAWDYDLRWKPFLSFPPRAGFVGSVLREQARLARGLDVRVPVLVCCSTRSTPPSTTALPAELAGADGVLDVAHMVKRAPLIGPDVAVAQIPGGIHDLALSAQPARDRYEGTVTSWARRQLLDDGA